MLLRPRSDFFIPATSPPGLTISTHPALALLLADSIVEMQLPMDAALLLLRMKRREILAFTGGYATGATVNLLRKIHATVPDGRFARIDFHCPAETFSIDACREIRLFCLTNLMEV